MEPCGIRLSPWFGVALFAAALMPARGDETAIDRVIVAADRLPDAQSSAPFSVSAIGSEELRRAPQLRLDDILRKEAPGFSLFRRNSSRTANPTAQGVTLRNFGPSGAGRTLVLLDGIPLNDPFAGYVLWSEVPVASVDTVLVQPGSGAGLFGNAALAGSIFLVSKPIEISSGSFLATVGTSDTYEGSLDGSVVQGPIGFELFADRFSTGGYPVVAAHQRGPIDRNASADSTFLDLRGAWQMDRDTSLIARARWFEDERGNGTPLTRNDTEGTDFSATLTRRVSSLSGELQVSGHGQRRKFASTFSSVNANRTTETPALDQFNVPADAAGGSVVWSMRASEHRLVFGGDVRWVQGETNEAFTWNGTRFTRLRRAGGEQFFTGIFAEDTWSIAPGTTIVGSARADHWELNDGFRRETDRATGALRLNTHFADRSGEEINGRLGARQKVSDTFAVRAAGFTGFRVPTLNELDRPFRVGNDVTEANSALQPEHLIGAEGGFEWQATSTLRLTATGFINRLQDAVSNVTIGVGPGTFNPGGFIPAGGTLRQRRNIDLIIAPGAEATAEWEVVPTVKLKASYLFTRPTIERAVDASLVGNLLAQTPEHVLTAGIEWSPTAKWLVKAQVFHATSQFEDDQNSRTLAPFTTVDLAVMYEFSEHASAAIRLENLLDTQIDSGKSADGLVSIGAPRLITLQFRCQL